MRDEPADQSRRGFLFGRHASATFNVRPPWTREMTVRSACNGCGECSIACPQQIVKLDANRRPLVIFGDECTFCGACADVCPEPVFDRSVEPFTHVARVGSDCFPKRGVICWSCGDACPEAVIRFRPRAGGPALPTIDESRCTGCGACVAICPAQAVMVEPLLEAVA
ncbi:ferredoxin-type protein NapF [Hansschlegelia zhihuaiae]|uniref:Ferredoxin-type protein NapF n=1 Tax=Hansschlegelia zhihuaiae TaxID=405005 RepID=A0A4Q0MC57_9HYPH|nr:ferredoxin-type protein NapF [Hansschlegelia zhihuaiae]RXF70900.1 ferredoxin-type protein NapF [Hansschlegelia zhihuaiae]